MWAGYSGSRARTFLEHYYNVRGPKSFYFATVRGKLIPLLLTHFYGYIRENQIHPNVWRREAAVQIGLWTLGELSNNGFSGELCDIRRESRIVKDNSYQGFWLNEPSEGLLCPPPAKKSWPGAVGNINSISVVDIVRYQLFALSGCLKMFR